MSKWLPVAGLFLYFATGLTVTAVSIRDDRDPQAYLNVGAERAYASVGKVDVDIFERGPTAEGSGTLVAPEWVHPALLAIPEPKAISMLLAAMLCLLSQRRCGFPGRCSMLARHGAKDHPVACP